MTKITTKAYKIRFTKGDHVKMEKSLKETSKVYKWLRDNDRYSKNEVRKKLRVQWSNIYQTFLEPVENINLERLITLNEMLPEKSLPEILTALVPDYSKEWWELGDHEEHILMNKFK